MENKSVIAKESVADVAHRQYYPSLTALTQVSISKFL